MHQPLCRIGIRKYGFCSGDTDCRTEPGSGACGPQCFRGRGRLKRPLARLAADSTIWDSLSPPLCQGFSRLATTSGTDAGRASSSLKTTPESPVRTETVYVSRRAPLRPPCAPLRTREVTPTEDLQRRQKAAARLVELSFNWVPRSGLGVAMLGRRRPISSRCPGTRRRHTAWARAAAPGAQLRRHRVALQR